MRNSDDSFWHKTCDGLLSPCILLVLLLALLLALHPVQARSSLSRNHPEVIQAFLDRIGGPGARHRIQTRLDERLREDGKEVFRISARKGRPLVEGSSLSAITTGIGWYLNHVAHINLAWNNLSTEFGNLPVPERTETHTCDATYRYYLNYCTFGYSMTSWTWERWEKEVDWMALHGINMPLQIIGLEEVWRQTLVEDGYTNEEAKAFAAGPAYIAWWGMNNLQGWGGNTRDAWFRRQADLGRKICDRERELGMQPVLPGFSGMVPVGYRGAESQGKWCGFDRPYILDPTDAGFATLAARYYGRLRQVLGESQYYSMDPFHEGGSISSGRYAEGYRAVYDAMDANCGSHAKWVIQQWQWAGYQKTALTAVPAGRLIVLDLFSDGSPAFDAYGGYAPQEAVYCTIPNFGGRTGFMGRLSRMAGNYFLFKGKYGNINGVGAAPEAIESVPVVYDLLFELPWMGGKPRMEQWVADYALARYGEENAHAVAAWQLLRNSALNETTALQGPHEAVLCGRPSLSVDKVSAWGGSGIFYDQDDVAEAAWQLLQMGKPASAEGQENYSYDLTDIVRQALTDYSKSLLAALNVTDARGHKEEFATLRDGFLQLILDIDELLGTNPAFRIGKWTSEARDAAREVEGCTPATQDWYELENSRTLLTTWGDYAQSEGGQLRDYSYREWQGLLRDYYYPRWKTWFDHDMQAPSSWFWHDWAWAHRMAWNYDDTQKSTTPLRVGDPGYSYSPEPEGDSYEVARRLFRKYFVRQEQDGKARYRYYLLDAGSQVTR